MPVLKSLVHIYEKSQMNRLWLTQIYLYRFYIPNFIRLANDVETNPGPGILAAPYSQGNVEVFGAANAGTDNVWQCLC